MVDNKSDKHNLKVGGQIQGISLESFLQMVLIEKKTCTLKVSTEKKLGFMHLLDGNLVAAETGDLTGENAAQKIISWESCDIVIEKFSGGNKKTIHKPLMTLLMNGLKYKDEKRERQVNQKKNIGQRSESSNTQRKLDSAEKLVDTYISNGNTESAVKLLYDLIIKNAKEKNFIKAESLREKLQDVDSLALNEIIGTAEIIEEENEIS